MAHLTIIVYQCTGLIVIVIFVLKNVIFYYYMTNPSLNIYLNWTVILNEQLIIKEFQKWNKKVMQKVYLVKLQGVR